MAQRFNGRLAGAPADCVAAMLFVPVRLTLPRVLMRSIQKHQNGDPRPMRPARVQSSEGVPGAPVAPVAHADLLLACYTRFTRLEMERDGWAALDTPLPSAHGSRNRKRSAKRSSPANIPERAP